MKACIVFVFVLLEFSALALPQRVNSFEGDGNKLLSQKMEEFVKKYNSTAAASYVANAEKICSYGSAGYAQVGQKPEFNVEGRIHMGSNTKSMTAVLVGILLEGNLVRGQKQGGPHEMWSTTLKEVFPDIAPDTPYENVSLGALASHYSGLPANTDFWSYNDAKPPATLFEQRQEITSDAFQMPPEGTPGASYLYSNLGIVVLGHVAEVSLKIEWEEAMLHYLIEPLDLLGNKKYWPFGAPDEALANWGHIYFSESLPHYPCNPSSPPSFLTSSYPDFKCDNPPNMGPAGTYSGSLLSLSNYYGWAIRCSRGSDTQSVIPLSQESCKLLQSPYKQNGDYGYGWSIKYELPGVNSFHEGSNQSVKVLSHAGSNTYNYVKVDVIPDLEAIYWAGTNSGSDLDQSMVREILRFLPSATLSSCNNE